MRLFKFFIDTFNEIIGNTVWYECRFCKTKVSKDLQYMRYLNKKFFIVLFYFLLATTFYYLIFDFIDGTFFEYFFFALGFVSLFLIVKIRFIKAKRFKIADDSVEVKCSKCDSKSIRPIIKNIFYKIL